ncbi:MAG TPA: glycosyltransferase family 39 protein [Terriglobales bacterium]|nr:glycosyltransferase family 39 protein [Terriglobales bacterium]
MHTVAAGQGAAVVDAPDRERPRSVTGSIRSALRKHPWLEWLIPAALCAFMFGQLLLIGRQLSQTCDEATHLYSGYRYLKCGDLADSLEHPPLAKIVAAAPLLPMNLAVNCAPFNGDDIQQAFAGLDWLYSQNWPAALARARMAVSVFAVGLCLLVWITARRMFGLTAAVLASLLLIFEPNVLAYGSLVMTDVPVTCMLLFAVLGFYLWVQHRTAPFLLLTALATGLTLLAKHSGVVVIPILGALAITDALTQADGNRPKWQLALYNLLAVALIYALAVGIVWAGYGMRFAAYTAVPQLQGPRPHAISASGRLLLELEEFHLLPQAYLEGFAGALAMSHQSSAAFVAGKIYLHAPWFSTPFNFLIRNTAAMLAMILAAAFGVAITFRQRRRERLFLLAPAVVYLAVCLHASINVSVRYLLPMFPFLLIAVADGCVELGKRVRWVSYALPCLIVLHAASSLHAYPNYLSYANDLWGGPSQAYKYESWLDIGQAYPEAKAYLERHPADPCWLLTDWYWNPGLYGVHCQPVGWWSLSRIPPHLRGTVILSSTLLTTIRPEQGQAVAPFRKGRPKDFVGGSALLVYEGDFDTRAAAGMSAWRATILGGEPFDAAMQDANDAIALVPNSPGAHSVRCQILAKSGQPYAALAECETALELAEGDPLNRAEWQQFHDFEGIEEIIRSIRAANNLPNP